MNATNDKDFDLRAAIRTLEIQKRFPDTLQQELISVIVEKLGGVQVKITAPSDTKIPVGGWEVI